MITKDRKDILLADDAAFFRNKLSAILAEVGHRVRSAANGAEAIEALDDPSCRTDLLILDLQMPEVDGFGVIEWMYENDLLDKVPVLIVTGVYENKEVLKKLSSFEITDVMTKAFTPEQVVCQVNKILFEAKTDIRKEERLPVSIPVDFVQDAAGNMQTGFILNITARGLFLHSRMKLEQDSTLRMRFSLPGVVNLIEAAGVVRWGSGAAKTSGLFQGNGVVFTEITEDDQELIRGFVNREHAKGSTPGDKARA
ncbi:hypothetical protein MNBD_DELTA02-1092 [hydrothermal vent metagenome]|uniref:Response regulatory domain-containing protein n=1 Tax=hydrothermal vent metagenome TaxID=652676 RepID=A0A3B0V5H2_9ZZZZ